MSAHETLPDRWVITLPTRASAVEPVWQPRTTRTGTVELGRVAAEHGVVARISLRNQGAEARRITAVTTTCACVALDTPLREIAAGAEVPLGFRLRQSSSAAIQAAVKVVLDGREVIEIPLRATLADDRPPLTVATRRTVSDDGRFDVPLLVIAPEQPAPPRVTLADDAMVHGRFSSGGWVRVNSIGPSEPGGNERIVWSASIGGEIENLKTFAVLTVEIDGHRPAHIYLSPAEPPSASPERIGFPPDARAGLQS